MGKTNIDPEKLNRSRVTNGRALLPDTALTSASARRWKDLHRMFTEAVERNAGGAANVTELMRLQVKYLAGLCHWAEQMTARLADDEGGVDMVAFNRAMGNIQRLIDRLGIATGATAEAVSIDGDDDFPDITANPLIHTSARMNGRHARGAR